MHLYLLLKIPAKLAEKSKILTKNHLFGPKLDILKLKFVKQLDMTFCPLSSLA